MVYRRCSTWELSPFFSVLGDKKLSTLPNGERLNLPPNTGIVTFVVEKIYRASSPIPVLASSRITVENNSMPFVNLFAGVLHNLSEDVDE